MKKISLTYNIFADLKSNLDDFEQEGIYIVGKPSARDAFDKKNRGMHGGYYYSQKDTLEAIELATNSKFKEGPIDREGKRKTYMNVVNFFADVALMKVNINPSNYVLEPTQNSYTWPVFFMDKAFKEWSEEESFDDIIDELAQDYTAKGSCVVKKVRGSVERVPLSCLKNSQGSKTLADAAMNGGYVIIEDEKSYNQMAKHPAWDLDGLDKKKTYCYYERYSLIPRAMLKYFNGEEWDKEDEDDMILCMQILLPDETKMKKKPEECDGNILFIEEVDELPLEEAHYHKIDGRWLGRGEIEKQLEAQISRNLTANLRRRSLVWATKKLFKSSDDEVQKNLLLETKDGDVLKVRKDADLAQVDTTSRHLGDFATDENIWKENSKENAFAFEVATGQSMPSGTPFRLGVVLDKAVSGYFKMKQDRFSNFLKRSFFSQLIPLFKKEIGECVLRYSLSDDNAEVLKNAMLILHTNERVFESYMAKKPKKYEDVAKEVQEEMLRNPYLFVNIPDKFFKEPQAYMKLNISEDIGPDIETLTTLFTVLSQRGDPRADKVLKMILAKQGKNFDAIAGPAKQVTSQDGAQDNQETKGTPATERLKEVASATA